jgi:diketogulonate reductase-like aldo/keto reductase
MWRQEADDQYSAPLSLSESWKGMEELKNEGLTRSIGVSNYREEDLLEMEPNWTIPPAVNQVSHS